jgi:hypothetical protein
MAPRTLIGPEADSVKRWIDSVRIAFQLKAGLDSSSLYDVPQGYVRVIEADGTTYLRKRTPEETEALERESQRPRDFGDIIAYSLDGQIAGKAGYRERGKPYKIDTSGLKPGTYMLSIPGEKQMKKIVVQ